MVTNTAIQPEANTVSPAIPNQKALVGARLPFGYVMVFDGSSNYTPSSAAGVIGPPNIEQISINPNADFEAVKLMKYDTNASATGGDGLISFALNSRELFFGSVYGINSEPGYANINTVFGNGSNPMVFEKPYTFPANRTIVGTYKDTTGTAGHLYCLFMGNNVFPSTSYLSSNSALTKTSITKTMQPIIYPVNLKITQANQQLTGQIQITQGENFIFQAIAINDSTYPVLINITFSEYGNNPLFSAPVPTRLINGTYTQNNNNSNVTTEGVRLFRLPSYINLASQTSVSVTVQDFLGKSNYFVNVSLYGMAASTAP